MVIPHYRTGQEEEEIEEQRKQEKQVRKIKVSDESADRLLGEYCASLDAWNKSCAEWRSCCIVFCNSGSIIVSTDQRYALVCIFGCQSVLFKVF
jgi:hypothetical protein